MAGSGSLSILAGGSPTDARAIIGETGDAVGAVSVIGNGSFWTNATELFVGQSGSGSLVIQDSAGVSSRQGTIGDAPGASGASGVVRVSSGSIWVVNGDGGELRIGNFGAGVLLVENGGSVVSQGGLIGTMQGGSGSVRIDASSWSTPWIQIGILGGKGALTIDFGGLVTTDQVTMGLSSDASASIRVSGAYSVPATPS